MISRERMTPLEKLDTELAFLQAKYKLELALDKKRTDILTLKELMNEFTVWERIKRIFRR